MNKLSKGKKTIIMTLLMIIGAIIVLFALAFLGSVIFKISITDLLKDWRLYIVWVVLIVIGVCAVVFDIRVRGSKRVLKVNTDLEDSHFMTKSEIAKNEGYTVTKLSELHKVSDGVPIIAEQKGKDIFVVLKQPQHTVVIGATGTGKTSAFIDPTIEILCRTKTKPSMVVTDPKGELYTHHGDKLKEQGYKVSVIDLADVYHSTRWNPFNDIWRKTERIKNCEIEQRKGKYICDKQVFLTMKEAESAKKSVQAKLKDEIFVDLQDLIYTMCPIENKNESSWEKGARDLILALAVAFWEDVYDGYMPREKFNLYNLYRTVSDYAKGDCNELRAYFATRSPNSKTHGLSNTVLVAEDRTLSSYLTDVSQYFTWMADTGIAALTSGNEIEFNDFDEVPNVLFLKIPDEKENRHKLVSLFITQMYKALVEKATDNMTSGKTTSQELLRNTYFIMDEFGNLPAFHRMDSIVTVGRSRKIWLMPVIQDFNQLDNKYGKEVAAIIRSNCNTQIFIGTNDDNTRKAFSDLCGKKKVKQVSYSENNDMSVSTSAQSVPLIYPNELEHLNDPANGVFGNIIVATLGNYPIKAKFTPFFQARAFYGADPTTLKPGEFIEFDEDAIHYDIMRYTAYKNVEEQLLTLSNDSLDSALDIQGEQVRQVGQVGQAEQEAKKKLAIKMLADVQKRLVQLKGKIPNEIFERLNESDIKSKLIMLNNLADDAAMQNNFMLSALCDQLRSFVLHRCFSPEQIEKVDKECKR